MKIFNRLVILDPIILSNNQWKILKSYSREVDNSFKDNRNENTRAINKYIEESSVTTNRSNFYNVDIKTLNERIKDADAIITCWTNIPDEVMLSNPKLEYIGFWTNLIKHRINLDFAKQQNILVTVTDDYGTESVAELTFTGILAIFRKLFRTHRDTIRGSWHYEFLKTGKYIPNIEDIPQKILNGKVLGIVGLGRIGLRVAEIAHAFRMQIQYWSRNRHREWEKNGLKYVELEELFANSDIVTVHLSPYAPEKIINANLIRKLKNNSVFVNTSAGKLIDQEALFEELVDNRIFAFLDVYEGLPPRKSLKILKTLDNIFTYRSGWYTQEALMKKGYYLLKNMESYLKGIPKSAAWDQVLEDNVDLDCYDGIASALVEG